METRFDASRHQPLREALIEAGLALLAEGGSTNLTLRRAAARAGVSHAAPAHHFKGLPGLLTAIAGRAFGRFCEAMTAAREARGAAPEARLLGVCDGYLRFAERHSGLFHLMFVEPSVMRSDPEVAVPAARAYGILREACAPFADPARPEVLETAVWSMVHGYATLRFDAEQSAKGPHGAAPPFAELLARLLRSPERSDPG